MSYEGNNFMFVYVCCYDLFRQNIIVIMVIGKFTKCHRLGFFEVLIY